MTKHECAIIMAYTGVTMLTGKDYPIFHSYVAKKLGRPVYTHEIAELSDVIKKLSKYDFVQLCKNATDSD